MATLQKYYWHVVLLFLLIKIGLAAAFPLTSDEAYFLQFGHSLSSTYYDHPPVTGFFMWLFSFASKGIFVPRLFPIAVHLLIFFVFRKTAEWFEDDATQIDLAALAFWVSPLHVLFVIMSTDVPLALFAFLSGVLLFKGLRLKSFSKIFIAGLLWGLAFYSKYLAILFAPALALAVVLFPGSLGFRARALFALLAGALVFPGVHIAQMTQFCYWPLMFNVFNRTTMPNHGLKGMVGFILFFIYLATPWLLIKMVRSRSLLKAQFAYTQTWWIFVTVPAAFMFALAYKESGLHWLVWFLPFIYFIAVALPRKVLFKTICWSAGYSLAHVIFIIVILLIPWGRFASHPLYSSVVLGSYGDELAVKLQQLYPQHHWATRGYASAALLDYFTDKKVSVIFDLDDNGRNDDLWTDWTEFEGRDVLIIKTEPFSEEDLQLTKKSFDRIEATKIKLRGAIYYLVDGRNFHFEAYRQSFLSEVKKLRYNFPEELPAPQCFFDRRYGF